MSRSTTNKQPTFNIYCMSIGRWDAIMSKNLFEYCTYVVREEQADKYRKARVEDLIEIPTGAVDDFVSTLYWIIDNTPEDVICVVDDDIKKMCYRTDNLNPIITKDGEFDKETATAECERIGQILYDLNLGLAFDTPNTKAWVYDKEFAFTGMPGHMRWINKSCLKAKLNREDSARSDIDMAMQELLMNRVILCPKYFCSDAYMDTNAGSSETRQEHYNFVEAMKIKWGIYYDYNYRKNTASIKVKR